MTTRRRFLQASLPALAGGLAAARNAYGWTDPPTLSLSNRFDPGKLPALFPDLRRHFLFEYYPWYGRDPFRHWEQWGRVPPADIASNHFPRLGAYDSGSRAVIEAHAGWISDSGAGGISLSWWGRNSYEDRLVPLIMDVMRDHGLKVTFHLEPYSTDRAFRWSEDILYLLKEYGENRRFDVLLMLRDAGGQEGPVFKGFRTILPERITDCHGRDQAVPDYTPDALWRRQNLGLKRLLAQDFGRLTLLADTVSFERAAAAGFDGIAIYDNYVRPQSYALYAAGATERDLLFSFNVNPGYDGIEPRRIEPGTCYPSTPIEPPASPEVDWREPNDRERAAGLHAQRIRESLQATLACQTDPTLTNARRGFLLAYINSWNEWHEGHAFEPMEDQPKLSPEQRAIGYHNPSDGGYRLAALTAELEPILSPAPVSAFTAVPDGFRTASNKTSLNERDAHFAQTAFGR